MELMFSIGHVLCASLLYAASLFRFSSLKNCSKLVEKVEEGGSKSSRLQVLFFSRRDLKVLNSCFLIDESFVIYFNLSPTTFRHFRPSFFFLILKVFFIVWHSKSCETIGERIEYKHPSGDSWLWSMTSEPSGFNKFSISYWMSNSSLLICHSNKDARHDRLY